MRVEALTHELKNCTTVFLLSIIVFNGFLPCLCCLSGVSSCYIIQLSIESPLEPYLCVGSASTFCLDLADIFTAIKGLCNVMVVVYNVAVESVYRSMWE